MTVSAVTTAHTERLEPTRSAKRLHGYRTVTEFANDIADVTVVTAVTKVLGPLKQKFVEHEFQTPCGPIKELLKGGLKKAVTAVTTVTCLKLLRDSVTNVNLKTVTNCNNGYRRALKYDFGVMP